MRGLTESDLAHLSALLISLYVFDVPRLIIEVWSLPLPRLGGRPPYLLPFVLIAGAALLTLAGRRGKGVGLHPVDLVFTFALLVCSAIALFHGVFGGLISFDLLTAMLVFYSSFLVVRFHANAFRSVDSLLAVMNYVGLSIVGAHSLLLIAVLFGFPFPGVSPSEIIERNGVSYIFVFLVFCNWFLTDRWPGWFAGLLLPSLALLHCWINGARGAFLILIALAGARFVVRADRSNLGAGLALAGALAAFAFTAAGLPLIVEVAPTFLGEGDDRISALSRLTTNYDLMRAVADSPLVGIGEFRAHAVDFRGYMSHTLPVLLLSSYGMIGTIPLLVAVLMMCGLIPNGATPSALMVVALSLLTTLFSNDLWPWLGVLFAVVWSRFEWPPDRPVTVLRRAEVDEGVHADR